MTVVMARPTLGLGVVRWLTQAAQLPSPADFTSDLVLTRAQIEFFCDWYSLDPVGRFVYRRAALQEAKGYGKSPEMALLAIAEFAGPVCFDGWEADGRPRGRPWESPLVQVAALSEDQATSNVYSLIFEFLRARDRRSAVALGLDENRGKLYRKGRPGLLEPVTSAADSREGQRLTLGLLDESHLLTKRNGGSALARTMRRNAAKVGGRTVETANAPELGYGSVAEATLADVAKGEPGILLRATRPSRMPEPAMSDDELLGLLDEVYADAPWVDRRRILAEVRDASSPWDESTRFYFNAPSGGASVLVDPKRWTELGTATGDIPDGARIGVGFDGSHSHDGTAVCIVDETGRTSLELLVEREPSDPPNWTVPRQQVHDVLADLFARFDVARMYADPFYWRDELDTWTRLYGEQIVLAQPTNSQRRFGPAVDRFRAAVAEGRIRHDGDPDLARHLGNARLVRGPGRAADDGHALFTIEKAGPGRLIDAAVAAILAYAALAEADAIEEPVKRDVLMAWA